VYGWAPGADGQDVMRVAIVHNLLAGGAHRRLREQMSRLSGEVVEVCPATAVPIRSDADVIPLPELAPRVPRALRVPLRYADLVTVLAAWLRVAARVRELGATVVYANPCRFLQAPAALLGSVPPALYFCDEPRRADYDLLAAGSRRALTRPVYAALYGAQRAVDRRSVAQARRVATNSAFSAAGIRSDYGRDAEVVPLGVSDAFRAVAPQPGEHVLSVGTLIPGKGHDLAIEAAARARRRRRVVLVAPRVDAAEAARLRALAAARAIELELHVGIPDQELAGLYATAHATVYMARGEPFGLASLEAQAAGSPVIVAAEGGLPETLAPGQEGWAVPRRAEAVAAKLDQLEHGEARAAAVAAGLRHAGEATWERSARAIDALLSELTRSCGS
jgi:glycosyltransferase involved in cell wall biosynthesis